MPIKSADIIGFPKSLLGIRVNLGVETPTKLTEDNLIQLFKDVFFYSTKGLYIEEDMIMNTNMQIIDNSSVYLSEQDLEENGTDIELIVKEYLNKYPTLNSWDLNKKWFGLVIVYIHFLLSKEESKEYLLQTIESILEKENDEIDYHTVLEYANALNLSVSLFGKEYLIPRFSSLLDIKSDLYEEIYEDNMVLFLDYQKELMDIIKSKLSIKDIDSLYGSKNYNKWYSFYDELFEDLYRFNHSSIIFSMANLSDKDYEDLKDILSDDLFASFTTMVDIDDVVMNDLIFKLSEFIVEKLKTEYVIKTEQNDSFDLLMEQIEKEFQTK